MIISFVHRQKVGQNSLNTGIYLYAVSHFNSSPTFVIKSAGRNNLTAVFEISLAEDSFNKLNLDAITP